MWAIFTKEISENSKTFGKFFSVELSEKENTSLYIPEGFAHGFCSLANNVVFPEPHKPINSKHFA